MRGRQHRLSVPIELRFAVVLMRTPLSPDASRLLLISQAAARIGQAVRAACQAHPVSPPRRTLPDSATVADNYQAYSLIENYFCRNIDRGSVMYCPTSVTSHRRSLRIRWQILAGVGVQAACHGGLDQLVGAVGQGVHVNRSRAAWWTSLAPRQLTWKEASAAADGVERRLTFQCSTASLRPDSAASKFR
jgi:hypothetical protein